MSDLDFTIVVAVLRDIADRLTKSDGAFTERQSDGFRALLKAMLLACPHDREIRPKVARFAEALADHLLIMNGTISPIRQSVATVRNRAMLNTVIQLAAAIETVDCEAASRPSSMT